jgi:hypothetical protein
MADTTISYPSRPSPSLQHGVDSPALQMSGRAEDLRHLVEYPAVVYVGKPIHYPSAPPGELSVVRPTNPRWRPERRDLQQSVYTLGTVSIGRILHDALTLLVEAKRLTELMADPNTTIYAHGSESYGIIAASLRLVLTYPTVVDYISRNFKVSASKKTGRPYFYGLGMLFLMYVEHYKVEQSARETPITRKELANYACAGNLKHSIMMSISMHMYVPRSAPGAPCARA